VTVEHVAAGQVIDASEPWVEHDDAKKQELASHERRHIIGSSSNIGYQHNTHALVASLAWQRTGKQQPYHL
jgi:hypothetical protein